MLGCAQNVIDENKVIQKIDSLDMTIFSKSGDKIYSITSPNSSYDNIELKFELKKPIINILNGKETKYIISSEESTLSDNNKLLKLKGNVKLKTLKNNENILNADRITIGIMAPCDTKAIEVLKSITEKYSSIKFGNLDSLHANGSVFLKGNQKTGNVFVRSENGLGEGILITCQYDEAAKESNTFGPLPLDFFT